jgi:hypothetical protein
MSEIQYKYKKEEKTHKVAEPSLQRWDNSSEYPDLIAKFPSGTVWDITIKDMSSKDAIIPIINPKARTNSRSTQVIANLTPEGVTYKSARSGRILTPPKPKTRKKAASYAS